MVFFFMTAIIGFWKRLREDCIAVYIGFMKGFVGFHKGFTRFFRWLNKRFMGFSRGLKRVCRVSVLKMGFCGSGFRCLLRITAGGSWVNRSTVWG